MNSLSWLIYAADVAGTVNVLSGAGIATAAGLVGLATWRHDADGRVWDEQQRDYARGPNIMPRPPETRPAPTKSFGAALTPALVGLALCASVNILVPAPATFYAIAASEMGERVLNSQTGAKAMKALDAWLNKQIAEGSQ